MCVLISIVHHMFGLAAKVTRDVSDTGLVFT